MGSDRPSALRRTAKATPADAGVDAADVVFADAAGTPELDAAEVAAPAEVFGAGRASVTAPKTMTGRLHSGGTPLDVVAALLSIRDGGIPPSVNTTGTASAGGEEPADVGPDSLDTTFEELGHDSPALLETQGRIERVRAVAWLPGRDSSCWEESTREGGGARIPATVLREAG
ncbi:Polyketide chain length factor WhiE-CLF [Actinokineospora spheciospongiae]|uniref:Polyketide chain length factor WhiE-CLF n=1 Tax=Actinokineospora spheciospongiae TaxID=909613 RepID=W7IHM8_9PSEU|nr:hypothetical protein [Actinokineospora spheciospongiae]EWC59833.1 Polyketide chain length factor WhiE-CLF [Actinokineospora spheciospongiae]